MKGMFVIATMLTAADIATKFNRLRAVLSRAARSRFVPQASFLELVVTAQDRGLRKILEWPGAVGADYRESELPLA
jgi:hypothetical protein